MGWQERFRELGEQLTSGQISTDDYRARSEALLAEADREAADTTQPTRQRDTQRETVHIPRSAAWEAPSGEMTQIVGTRDETTLVGRPVADALNTENEPDK
ncbi:hypothetical protein BLA60_32415 [Actinophytocola xinjiangensis]|uniref:Uncharacterized protein n=1 Tax=Actinophytocola xinjiangensis TaxID=485602 RepID=A0A7Z1AW04_9PSEU|nr:hypothetical protein [Actinophytocola xinjiangensis]OLF06341.1 hypothetical protein BLA60_32415 [Actinophytocola xinjiangensis]